MDNVKYIVCLRYVFLMSFNGAILAHDTGPNQPIFGESYNITCTFSRDMLVTLSFTSAESGQTTTLYSPARQHQEFWNLFDCYNRADGSGLNNVYVFTIRKVTSDRLGTYKCYDDRTGAVVDTKLLLTARSADRATPEHRNNVADFEVNERTTTGTNSESSSADVLVIIGSIAFVVVVVVVVIAVIQRKRIIGICKNINERRTAQLAEVSIMHPSSDVDTPSPTSKSAEELQRDNAKETKLLCSTNIDDTNEL